jgi:peptidylprolyl isomerase
MFHKFAIILIMLCATTVVIGEGQPDSGPTKVTGDPVTMPDGLKYWDIAVGKGAPAVSGKRVRVHYTGWLLDGTKFDSSLDAGHPFVFTLGRGQVIPGWDEGLLGMREGGKRQLRVPAELAYGEQGSPPTIPPNSTLIFDIQLLNVER